MKNKLGIAGALLLTAVLGAAEVKPVFHAPFDLDFRADVPSGKVEGKHSMPITMETLSMLLHPGVKGNAAKIGTQVTSSGTDASLIQYPGSVLNTKQGTVSFWMKPVDWDFKDTKFHVFCEARGDNSWLVLYKYKDAHELYFLFGRMKSADSGNGFVIVEAPAVKWERGSFHHVTATWDEQNIRIYTDGILQAAVKIPAAKRPEKFDTFCAGPYTPNAWPNPQGDTLLDDLRVYDRALTGSEVEELYASYNFRKIDKSQIPVKFNRIKMNPSADGKALDLFFSLTRTTQKRSGFPVEMEVILNDKTTVLKKTLQAASTEYNWRFQIADLAQGDYKLILRPVRETPQDKIEDGSFLFRIGDAEPVVDHSVPEPWTPVKAVVRSGNSGLTSWLQRILPGDAEPRGAELTSLFQRVEFSRSIFPVQMFSGKVPLLRGAMRFELNGKAFAPAEKTKIVEQQDDFAVVETAGTDSGFELSSRCRFEFDGMMWFDVTLTPKGKDSVNSAKIVVPLRPEVSTLFNRFAKDYFQFRGFRAGELRQTVKSNHFDETDQLPVMWVGNDERGLYYFAQDQAGRRLKNRAETLRLDPGKDGATLTINLVDYVFTPEKPVTWSFGLQITPVRPFVRNRRLWRPWSAVNLWFPWEKIHNVPDARFAKDNYPAMRKSFSSDGSIPLFHYFAGFSASPENPGYPQHANEWSITPPPAGTEVSPNDREWRYVFMCAGSRSYRDYYLRSMSRCMRELKMQELYFDNCWSWFCGNEAHGCGWTDEHGKKYCTANILGSRELAKNIYREHRRQYPYGLIVRHISQIPEPPLISFCDALVDGECFMLDVGRDESYYNVFRPDFFRASFRGEQFGMPSVFIPQFERAYQLHFPEKLKDSQAGKLPGQEKHIRHFIGYILAHDTHAWPNFGVSVSKYLKIMDNAGITDDSAFYGYWQPDSPVRTAGTLSDRIMASAYAADNGALVILMNDTDQPADVLLSLDSKVFGNSPALSDAESGKTLSGTAVSVPARDFRMIRIIKK